MKEEVEVEEAATSRAAARAVMDEEQPGEPVDLRCAEQQQTELLSLIISGEEEAAATQEEESDLGGKEEGE